MSASGQEKGTRKILSDIIDRKDAKCNGLKVRRNAGAFASSHVFPMVVMFSSFYMNGMPLDPFVIIEVKAMRMKLHLDV